ncbi:MAG: hypothetical protein D6795_12340 [Deltaproteobacteria bacterium]|nr:MAG: hypothetical protein D6795_12340 [Deltaproteobacteria bacterium]
MTRVAMTTLLVSAMLGTGCGVLDEEVFTSADSTIEATFSFSLDGTDPDRLSERQDFSIPDQLRDDPDLADQIDQIEEIETMTIESAVYTITRNDTRFGVPSLEFLVVPFGAPDADEPILTAVSLPLPPEEVVEANALLFLDTTILPPEVLAAERFSAYIRGTIPEDLSIDVEVTISFRITLKVKVKVV